MVRDAVISAADAAAKHPQLVVPADLSGARYVRDLTDLRVVNPAYP